MVEHGARSTDDYFELLNRSGGRRELLKDERLFGCSR